MGLGQDAHTCISGMQRVLLTLFLLAWYSNNFLHLSLSFSEVEKAVKKVPSSKKCLLSSVFFRRHSLHGTTSSGVFGCRLWERMDIKFQKRTLGRRRIFKDVFEQGNDWALYDQEV